SPVPHRRRGSRRRPRCRPRPRGCRARRGSRTRAPCAPRATRRARGAPGRCAGRGSEDRPDRKSTRLNSSHVKISYAVFCLKKKWIVWLLLLHFDFSILGLMVFTFGSLVG